MIDIMCAVKFILIGLCFGGVNAFLIILYIDKKTLKKTLTRWDSERWPLQFYYALPQTQELCLAMVKKDGWAIIYVQEEFKTLELYLAAVQQNGLVLEMITEQTHEICEAAIRQNWLAIKYAKVQTMHLCLIAVEQSWYAYEFITCDAIKLNLTVNIVSNMEEYYE